MSHQRTVYVIDQDLCSRRSVTSHLAALGAEAWPFSSAAEFLEILDHLTPGCVVLGVESEESEGFAVLAALALRDPGWPVIATSARSDIRLAVQAMKLGALDFLEKPVSRDGLADSLLPAYERLQQSLASSEALRRAQQQLARLTPRETEIALALLAGQANKGAAHSLGISVRTVEMHRAHIMTKLGVRSLAEAAVIATQAGLLSMPRPAPPTARAMLRSVPTGGRADVVEFQRGATLTAV